MYKALEPLQLFDFFINLFLLLFQKFQEGLGAAVIQIVFNFRERHIQFFQHGNSGKDFKLCVGVIAVPIFSHYFRREDTDIIVME